MDGGWDSSLLTGLVGGGCVGFVEVMVYMELGTMMSGKGEAVLAAPTAL